jgi:hypothetical protein
VHLLELVARKKARHMSAPGLPGKDAGDRKACPAIPTPPASWPTIASAPTDRQP